ncbi:MAG: hypothetical protein PHU06_06055 [Gallionella sp.]|nr:hypothetical protein [Gallionella sp.]
MIIQSFGAPSMETEHQVRGALSRYQRMLEPYAHAIAGRLVTELDRRDRAAWRIYGQQLSAGLKREIQTAPLKETLRKLQAERVAVILSLPETEAARVQREAMANFTESKRAGSLKREIMGQTGLSERHAMLIARTETSAASSMLTQARSQLIGSEGYIWRTAEDEGVRLTHSLMEGRFVRWDQPPKLQGMVGHAGCFPNCFLGSTPVDLSYGLKHLLRVPYQGRGIVLKVGGATISLTPNHPMWTTHGWIAAQDLKVGDYIVQTVRKNISAIQLDKPKRLPTFDELFASKCFEKRVGSSSLEFNFYGDVPNGQVDQIFPTHALLDWLKAGQFKVADDLSFAKTNGGILTIAAFGRQHQVSVSNISSSAQDFLPTAKPDIGHSLTGSFAAVAGLDSAVKQDLTYYNSAKAMLNGQSLLAGAGDIIGDELCTLLPVEGVSHRYFAQTHVYTLETMTGYYTVAENGCTTKNCRCYPEPVIPTKFLR